jgi:hypothetical protein
MSYEGFVQYLTDKGHYFSLDTYDDGPEAYLRETLPGETIVWKNYVDQTNGSWDEDGNRIDGFVELETEVRERTSECKHCGRYDEDVRYKLPPIGQGNRIEEKGIESPSDNVTPRISPLAYLWAGPTTLFGLLVALLTASWRPHCVDGVIEIDGHRTIWVLGRVLRVIAWATRSKAISPAAFTLGHVIFYADEDRYWRPHERVHVRQNEKWGIAWLPVYLMASAWAMVTGKNPYYDNFFEVEAYRFWPG